MLDFVFLIYLSTFKDEVDLNQDPTGATDLEKELDIFYTDHIKFALRDLQTVEKLHLITTEEYRLAIDKQYQRFRPFFVDAIPNYEDPTSKLVEQKYRSPSTYFKRIASNDSTIRYVPAYDFYLFYSKFEHLGIFSNEFQTQDMNESLERIIHSIYFLITGLVICIYDMDRTGEKYKTEHQTVSAALTEYSSFLKDISAS